MPVFSKSSKKKLDTCDPRLQEIFNIVVKKYDCTIVCGHRDKYSQDLAHAQGNSKLLFPQSKHNQNPSLAIDVAPYYRGIGLDWSDAGGFYLLAGYVMRVADELGYKLRYGGDWDGDHRTKDQTFNDLVHFELAE